MTFNVSGSIILDSIQCFHCDRKFRFLTTNKLENCTTCGAVYEQIKYDLGDKGIDCTYDFKGFRCKYYNCEEECPLAFMYCLEHCKDTFVERVESSIRGAENTIKNENEKLKLIEESKKTWLVTKFK